MALGSTNTGGDNPRKVQFSKDTKPAATHFDMLGKSTSLMYFVKGVANLLYTIVYWLIFKCISAF